MPPESATVTTSFASRPFREVAGTLLRPGGTELTDRALSCCGLNARSRLLDVGCGVGATVEHLRSRHGHDAAGIDISAELIAEGKRRNPGLPLSEGNADDLPVGDEELDGIFCECVLSLLDKPRHVLGEFRRTLRPEAFLVLSDLYLRGTAKETRLNGFPEGRLSPAAMTQETLETLLYESGFSLCLWEDHTRCLQELAARLMLAHGSLDGFCGLPQSAGCSGERPGYYLAVARKKVR